MCVCALSALHTCNPLYINILARRCILSITQPKSLGIADHDNNPITVHLEFIYLHNFFAICVNYEK